MAFISAKTPSVYHALIFKNNLSNQRKYKLIIRRYQSSDLDEITTLFYDTVHSINLRDYNQEQLSVWAPEQVDLEKWDISLSSNYSLVAIQNNQVVGFGDIEKTGYINRLYTHKDYQGKGIATMIYNKLEKHSQANKRIVHASITAKLFLKKEGLNYYMSKQ